MEVQAAPDKQMYWRTSREVSTFFEQRPNLKNTAWYAYVIWLDGEDDGGFQTTHIYDQQKKQRILSVHLIDILRKLPNNSLALNVLRPLIVDTEQEVRQNITTWVEQIHQAELSPQTEQRLLMVMTQLIEEKFRILSYKELCEMLKLTPFDQTDTFIETYQKKLQEDLKKDRMEDRVGLLIKLMKCKYHFARSTLVKLDTRLRQLTLKDLENLFEAIFDLPTLRALNAWIDSRLPQNDPSQLANLQN